MMTLLLKNIITSLVIFLSVSIYAKPIIIVLDADMSAVAAEGGIAIQRGAQIAIDEINLSGGVLGRKLELAIRDHRGNPARGKVNIDYFGSREDVVAVLGGVHTPVALHELESIHQHKLIYLGPWAAGTPVVKNGYEPNYVFRLSVRDEHAGEVLLKYAAKSNLKSVGLLLEQTGWGRSNKVSMSAAADKYNIQVKDIQWFNWREKTLKNQIDSLLSKNVDAILLVANAPEGAAIIKELASRSENLRVPVISHWGIASGSFVKKTGLATLKKVDVKVLQTYSFSKPENKEKMEKVFNDYKEKFDSSITPMTIPAQVGVVHAYDLVHLLAIAIKKAGSIDRVVVRSELEKIESYRGVTKDFSPPFTAERHDALAPEDYIITQYNSDGFLIPVN